MTRPTSVKAYNEIKENGLLSQRRWEVYDAVYKYGPCTSAEAFSRTNKYSRNKAITSSRSRFTELREQGVLQELGEKVCSITGHTAIEWEVTDKLPVKFERKESPREKKKRSILNSIHKVRARLNEGEELPMKRFNTWLGRIEKAVSEL